MLFRSTKILLFPFICSFNHSFQLLDALGIQFLELGKELESCNGLVLPIHPFKHMLGCTYLPDTMLDAGSNTKMCKP